MDINFDKINIKIGQIVIFNKIVHDCNTTFTYKMANLLGAPNSHIQGHDHIIILTTNLTKHVVSQF